MPQTNTRSSNENKRTKPRVKVVRPVAPNPGLTLQFSKKLRAVYAKFDRNLRKAALLSYQEGNTAIAQDGVAALAMDAGPTPFMRRLIETMAREKIALGQNARQVSEWFCRKLYFHVSRIQKRHLENAGVSKAFLRKNWQVPVIRGQTISGKARAGLEQHIIWMTELITRMSEKSCERVQKHVWESINEGRSYDDFVSTLRTMENMDDARAARVARDQTAKLNQFIQNENAKSLGIREAIWIHHPGLYTWRETHKAMDKQRFNLDEGMYDPDPQIMRHVQPKELPFCQCACMMVLPEDILEK